MTVEERLRHYILNELAPTGQRHLTNDEPLFEGALDSTSVLALVGYLESEFGMEIPDAEVVPAHFSTLRRIAEYVERKRAHARLAASAV